MRKNQMNCCPNLSIQQFDDRSQKHPEGFNLPDWMPKHEFLLVMIAPAGSGKTTLLLNILLNMYKGYWHKINIFSPTVHTDGKWEHVKECKDILMPLPKTMRENEEKNNKSNQTINAITVEELIDQIEDDMYSSKKSTLKHPYKASYYKPKENGSHSRHENKAKEKMNKMEYLMKNILQFPNKDEHDARVMENFLKATYQSNIIGHLKPDDSEDKDHDASQKGTLQMKEDDFKDEYEEDSLNTLMSSQDVLTKKLKKQKKDLASNMPRLLWVFDDMVGSGLFNQKRNNAFKRLTVRRRHFYSSLICVTQAYKEIPKTTRTNANILILFKIDSDEELITIYREYPMGLKWPIWMKVYKFCTQEPYSFIMFNLQTSNPDLKICRNFDTPITRFYIDHVLANTPDV